MPENTGGGRLVLYRHLKGLKDFELLVISDGLVAEFNSVALKHKAFSRTCKRLARTPLRRFALDAQELFLPCYRKDLAAACDVFRPHVIMTVAHGPLANMAAMEARERNVPLVTFFHDWWPDLAGGHDFLVPMLDKRFRELHRQSAVSFCVCGGMLAHLGSHPGAEILYPMPPRLESSIHAQAVRHTGGIKAIYMGNLSEYGPMMQEALEASKSSPNVRIEAGGGNPAWPLAVKNEMRRLGLWHDFLPEAQLGSWLAEADVFLVPMRFDDDSRRFMETSFPSKLVHYVQLGKPIVIWGPEHCSATRWARACDGALCMTDPNPTALIRKLETLTDLELRHWSQRAKDLAVHEFNPDRIQRQFITAVTSARDSAKQRVQGARSVETAV